MAKLKHPIREAERYLENARQLLSEKAEKDGDYYTHRKYVRKAGRIAWDGVLIALDAVLKVKDTFTKGQLPDIKDYEEAIEKVDIKMPRILKNSYYTLNTMLGYDGILHYGIVQAALEEAQNMISWADKHYQN